jgi:hypothetical protein
MRVLLFLMDFVLFLQQESFLIAKLNIVLLLIKIESEEVLYGTVVGCQSVRLNSSSLYL